MLVISSGCEAVDNFVSPAVRHGANLIGIA